MNNLLDLKLYRVGDSVGRVTIVNAPHPSAALKWAKHGGAVTDVNLDEEGVVLSSMLDCDEDDFKFQIKMLKDTIKQKNKEIKDLKLELDAERTSGKIAVEMYEDLLERNEGASG